jgi:hypothetical protein
LAIMNTQLLICSRLILTLKRSGKA